MKLKDLLGDINLDDFIIIFDVADDEEDEENALFNGCVEEFWKNEEEEKVAKLMNRKVASISVRELKDTIGAGIEIIVW